MMSLASLTTSPGPGVQGAASSSMTEYSTNLPLPEPQSTSLEVYPPAVQFEGVQPGFAYAMTISVRNVGKDPRRIRLAIPHVRSLFMVRYEPQPSLAMGMELRAEIEFRIREDDPEVKSVMDARAFDVFTEKLLVTSGAETVVVPLTAALPSANIVFDSFVNVGPVVVEQSGRGEVEVRNTGSREGTAKFVYDDTLPMTIHPPEVRLEPGKSAMVHVDVEGKHLGPFRAIAEVHVERQPKRHLDIHAQVVEQRLELVYEKGRGLISNVDFGAIFYGQRRIVRAVLVNNGPHPMGYFTIYEVNESVHERLALPPGFKDAVGEVANDEESMIMIVTPDEGLLEPMGQTPLEFIFQPRKRGYMKGFESHVPDATRTIAFNVTVEATEGAQKIGVQMVGRAVEPAMRMSHEQLDFGPCPMNDRRDIPITLDNPTELPLAFEFAPLPLVHALPSSGTIPPRQSLPVVVTYRPTQMGPLDALLTCKAAGGIVTASVRLRGECLNIGSKHVPRVQGIDKVPEDFQPKFEFVDPDEVERHKHEKHEWTRGKPYNEVDLLASLSWDETIDDNPQSAMSRATYTYSVQELQRRDDHRTKYNEFLRTSRTDREAKARKAHETCRRAKLKRDPNDQEAADLGLARGMPEPRLGLPPPADHLWLERPMNGGEQPQHGSRKKLPVDENRLINRKFKASPTTQAEVRDCGKTLSPQDLLNIVPSTKVLNFGRVSIDSTVVKNFAIGNFMHQCCLITLGKLDHELRKSGPESQVVPEGSVAGFDIKFSSSSIGNIKRSVSYVLNDRHAFKFTVIAEVVPLEIRLSTNQLTMSFPEDSLESAVSETLSMENPGTAACDFYWAARGAFAVTPEQGNIPPGTKMEAVITWRPGPAYKNEDVLSLSVPGGRDVELKISGICSEAKVAAVEKKLDFGTIAVGLKQEKVVRLKNQGTTPAVVFFDSTVKHMGLAVSPEVFRFGPGETIETVVSLTPPAPRNYQGLFVTYNVRGGKNTRVALAADAIVPDVRIEQSAFEFGGVVIGADVSLPLTLVNRGAIAACLILDLTPYLGFAIVYGVNELEVAPVIATDTSLDKLDTITLITPLAGDDPIDIVIEEDPDKPSGVTKWQLVVPPGAIMTMQLMYMPEEPGAAVFNLPLGLKGVPSDVSLAVPVKAIGLEPKLVMSAGVVDFGDRVVSRDGGGLHTYHKEVIFANAGRTGITWELDDAILRELKARDPHSPNMFFVSPRSGDLSPNESVQIRVTFTPKGPHHYKVDLPIYLAEQTDRTRPYLTMRLRGSGVKPSLGFDCPAVNMPIVPLHVKSRTRFHVVNHGFTTLQLNHKLPSYAPVQLTLSFPDGKHVGSGITKVPVDIEFTASQSVSFNVILEFSDNDGNSFSVPVLGCADNCVLTNFRFLSMYADKYMLYKKDGGPVTLWHQTAIRALKEHEAKLKEAERHKRAEDRIATIKALTGAMTGGDVLNKGDETPATNRGPSSSNALGRKSNIGRGANEGDGANAAKPPQQEEMATDLDRPDPPISERSLQVLVSWLNFHVMQTKIANFPQDLYDNSGRLAYEALELMSGKTPPGKAKAIAPNRRARVGQLMAQYSDMLVFLKEKGALLNTVTPESLMCREDYLYFKEAMDEKRVANANHMSPSHAKEQRADWENNYQAVSTESWAMVLYQAVRVFMLMRVTLKSYKSLPGVREPVSNRERSDKKEEALLSSSTAYTASENILLKWLNYHISATTVPSYHVTTSGVCDFAKDLKDGAAFAQAIVSHVPHLKDPGGPLEGYQGTTRVVELQGIELRRANAKRVVDALKALRLDLGVTPDTIVQGSNVDLLLIALHLYQTLPQFVPRTTVEFRSVLGTLNRKLIELQNTNPFPIKYQVTLEGCSDFHIETEAVELAPMSSLEYPVECEPRFSKPVEGRLTFWVQRTGGKLGTNLVFLLSSTVTSRKALATYNFTASCYEPTTCSVEIRNPFPADCSFTVSTIQTFTDPVYFRSNGKGEPNKTKASKSGGPGKKRNDAPPRKLTPTPNRLRPNNEDEIEVLSVLTSPFSCQEVFRLRANDTGTLTLQAIGFFPGVYTCQVGLADTNSGEFALDLILIVELPRPQQRLECSLSSEEGSTIVREFRIPSSNQNLQKALSAAVERLPSSIRQKARQVLTGLIRPSVNPFNLASYRVEIDSPYWDSAHNVDIVIDGGITQQTDSAGGATDARAGGTGSAGGATGAGGAGVGVGAGGTASTVATKPAKPAREWQAALDMPSSDIAQDSANRVLVTLNAKEPGSYPCRVCLYPMSSAAPDFRIFEIEAEVLTVKTQTAFTFRAPARQAITQEIPVTNTSAEPWELQVSIEGSSVFTGPQIITVPPSSKGDRTARYRLMYKPTWMGEEKARLIFQSAATGEGFEYQLTGIAEEPLAEAPVEITCKARETKEAVIKVTNHLREKATYKVESDLPYVNGDAEITIGGHATKDYVFTVCPQMGGVYNGTVTFTAPTGQYSWVPVQVTAGLPAAETLIEANAKVREAVEIDLVIDNPLDESVTFEVMTEGDYLLGDSELTVDAKASKAYQLIYSPLVAKTHAGSISFINAKAGEFWFKIKLHAEPAAPILVGPVSCVVGDRVTVPVILENPVGMDALFDVHISNKRNFAIWPQQISATPYGSTHFQVIYTPSSLSIPEAGTVTLSHPELGVWVYEAQGVGELPGIMPEQSPSSVVGELTSFMFPFKNPFSMPISITVTLRVDPLALEGEQGSVSGGSLTESKTNSSPRDELTGRRRPAENEGALKEIEAFALLLKKPDNIPLPAFGMLQVPISFYPKTIATRTATVDVRGSYKGHDLLWVYPIRGVSEAPLQRRAFTIKCQAKRTARQEVELELRGLEVVDPGGEELMHELKLPEKLTDQLSKWLSVAPIKNTVVTPGEKVKYLLTFEPEKMVNIVVELVVSRRSGGRWRYEVMLEGSDPEPDDTIVIEAGVNTTTIANFKLTNRLLNYAPFQAYFSTDSSYNITVTPSSGVLPPVGTAGQIFSLAFSPNEYGQYQRGRLYIETDDSLWAFEIKGTYPGFDPPTHVQPKVDSHLSINLQKSREERLHIIQTVNVVRKNMKSKALHASADALKRRLAAKKALTARSARFGGLRMAVDDSEITLGVEESAVY